MKQVVTNSGNSVVSDSGQEILSGIGKLIACLYDSSSHMGSITSTNQDNNFYINLISPVSSSTGITFGDAGFGSPDEGVGGLKAYPAVQGAQHTCPIPTHGTTSITAITTRSFVGQKSPKTYNGGGAAFGTTSFDGMPEGTTIDQGILILTYGAQAGCGAIITPINRGVYVE